MVGIYVTLFHCMQMISCSICVICCRFYFLQHLFRLYLDIKRCWLLYWLETPSLGPIWPSLRRSRGPGFPFGCQGDWAGLFSGWGVGPRQTAWSLSDWLSSRTEADLGTYLWGSSSLWIRLWPPLCVSVCLNSQWLLHVYLPVNFAHCGWLSEGFKDGRRGGGGTLIHPQRTSTYKFPVMLWMWASVSFRGFVM